MQVVINWSRRLQKHKTLEILIRVDFYAFFKISHFSSFFLNSSLAHSKIVDCILFHLNMIGKTHWNLVRPFLTINISWLLRASGLNVKL